MTLYAWLIGALWLALIVYWVASAARLRRTSGTRWSWWREIAVRLGFFAFLVLALQLASLPSVALYPPAGGWRLAFFGFVLCLGGIALAVLARAHLDRARDACASQAQSHALLSRGPYRLVRHPLYAGLLLAMVGSVLAQSLLWVLPLAVYGPLFLLSARREERRLREQFPESYPAYVARTKMLVPFLF